MKENEDLDELLICRLDEGGKRVEPCTIVIFGASGDLTKRKLIPALYHLYCEDLLPDPFRIVGFARRDKTNEQWRKELKEGFQEFALEKGANLEHWEAFEQCVSYCRGDITEPDAYQKLAEHLASFDSEALRRNVLFYLAIFPSQFAGAVRHLYENDLLRKSGESSYWQRIVVEKPFGHDLASAQKLNTELTRYTYERQIFRIDHYLGKETVQNILIFRFSNAIFEELWDRKSIDHIQITVGEKSGVGSRGAYYEEAGALRDMVQNHLLQVMALIGMEPPVSLGPEAIRDEKVKFLQAIRPIRGNRVNQQVVRGQYTAGEVDRQQVPGYRDEWRVDPNSNVETFVALQMWVDNWRWSGVPFFLRTGKHLPTGASEVKIQFRPTPHVLFAAQCGPKLDANGITIRLQPNEGISLQFNAKIPGASTQVRPVWMDFDYDQEFGTRTPEAYERLLLEAIAGDPTLFIRRDELESAWQIVDSIRAGWDGQLLSEREFYSAGTWGPAAADDLLERSGRVWRNPKSDS